MVEGYEDEEKMELEERGMKTLVAVVRRKGQ
jgi:hypothetical protein